MHPLYGHELCDGEKSRGHMCSAAFLFVNFPPINPILYLYYMIPLLLGNLGFPKSGPGFPGIWSGRRTIPVLRGINNEERDLAHQLLKE